MQRPAVGCHRSLRRRRSRLVHVRRLFRCAGRRAPEHRIGLAPVDLGISVGVSPCPLSSNSRAVASVRMNARAIAIRRLSCSIPRRSPFSTRNELDVGGQRNCSPPHNQRNVRNISPQGNPPTLSRRISKRRLAGMNEKREPSHQGRLTQLVDRHSETGALIGRDAQPTRTNSISQRRPCARARRESAVSKRTSKASATATYDASYAVRLLRNSQQRPSNGAWAGGRSATTPSSSAWPMRSELRCTHGMLAWLVELPVSC